MKHKGCGGEVMENYMLPYEVEYHAVLECIRCGKEVLGDLDIEEDKCQRKSDALSATES